MTPKPRFLVMDKDDTIWQQLDESTDEWLKTVRKEETRRAIGNLILEHRPGEAEVLHAVIKGGYNVIYRLEYANGSSIILRMPIKGIVPFPDEKVRYEVATMRYVAAHTTIPVPHVHHFAAAADNPTGLGPYIIMDYIENHQNVSTALLDPEQKIDERPFLNPAISEDKLQHLYAQMANIMLQLSKLKFPRIGSLVEDNDATDSIAVKARPLTSNMCDIVVHTKAPSIILPSRTYTSTAEWYRALADMHLAQLAFRHNDAVEDEDDARDKYVARQLFRNIAAERQLFQDQDGCGQDFRLFSEDFRPTNVLLDKDLQVVGVIDWEFAYAAPASFSFDPPWWLLLEEPEYWPGGYRAWMEAYEPRLQTFLRVLEAEEKKYDCVPPNERLNGTSVTDERAEIPLSQRIRDSWEKQTWMVKYAARKSWAFDCVWWKFLDERYFGANENQDHLPRLEVLSKPQQEVMGRFVARKMEERARGGVTTWTDEDAAKYLAGLVI